MKKLLTLLAVSTLVGTSASSLKPVFTNNVISHGFKSNQLNNKEINIKNENNSNPFINTVINDIKTKIVKIAPNGTIWVGTEKGLWKSTDGNHFEKVQGFNYVIYDIAFSPDGTVWISASGIYKSIDGNNFSKISGDVNGLKFEITADGTIWLSNTIYHCLWKSTDGTNFSKIVLNDSFWNIKISPKGTVWVGGLTSVYKSIDGITFLNVSKDGNFVGNLKFGLDGTIYSCNTIEILKSTDGNNFTKIGNFGSEGIFSIDVAKDGTIYFGTKGGLLKPGKLDLVQNL